MLKLILMSLFFPLIPILKPILIALGQMAKTMVGGLIPKTQTEEIAASSGAIAGAAIGFGIGGPWGALIGGVLGGIVGQLLAKLIEWLAKIDWVGLGKDISVFMLKILTGAFNGILELFGMKEEDIGNTLTVLRDIFEYTVSWLSNNWNSIKSTLDFVTTWLDESWTNIKTALSDAEVMIINIVEAFKKIYNKIAETWGGHILGLEPIPTSSGGSSGGNVNHTGNANVVHNNTGGYVPNQSNASGQSSYYNAYMSGAGILDGIVQNGRIITTHPDDFLIATKNPGSLGKGMTVNINIDRPSVTNQNDIKALVKEIEMELYKAQRRYNSYA